MFHAGQSGRRVRILSVAEFRRRFGSEQQCGAWLARVRWPDGFVCPGCGQRSAVFLRPRRLHQCNACRRQTSLTAGTIFHKSRIALEKWFWAIYRLAQDKKGCPATLLSKELDVSYPTAWLMAHKIRQAMAGDEPRPLLERLIELDHAYLGGQPRRGPRGKTGLFVAVERLASGRLGRAAIEATRQSRRTRLAAFARRRLAPPAVIRSAARSTFSPLGSMGYRHLARPTSGSRSQSPGPSSQPPGPPRRACRAPHLPAVHLVISNLNRFLLGRHHATAPKHAQRYVGEFVCRFNHRHQELTLFQRILTLAAQAPPITYPQLVAAELR